MKSSDEWKDEQGASKLLLYRLARRLERAMFKHKQTNTCLYVLILLWRSAEQNISNMVVQ